MQALLLAATLAAASPTAQPLSEAAHAIAAGRLEPEAYDRNFADIEPRFERQCCLGAGDSACPLNASRRSGDGGGVWHSGIRRGARYS